MGTKRYKWVSDKGSTTLGWLYFKWFGLWWKVDYVWEWEITKAISKHKKPRVVQYYES